MFCLRAYMCTISIVGALRSQKSALDSLELKLPMIVSFCVDFGSWTGVLGRAASAPNYWAIYLFSSLMLSIVEQNRENDSRCMLWNSSTVLGSYLTCLIVLHEYLFTTKINWSCMFYAITAFKRLIGVCVSDVFVRVRKSCRPSVVSGIGLGSLVLYSKCFTHQAFLPAPITCVQV